MINICTKEYLLTSENLNDLDKFNRILKYNNIKFIAKLVPQYLVSTKAKLIIRINISDDMVTEVEELIENIAKECFVCLEK